jgi:hypothetical protein
MARGSFMSFALAAAVAVAGGCDRTVSLIEVAPGCPERPMRGPEQWAAAPETQLIDDFESGGPSIARQEGRDGEWVLSTTKDHDAGTSTAGTSSLCVARGLFAGHFVATNSTDWGAMWTADFRATLTGIAQPYDGSKYGKLSFWAAFDAANGAPFSIRVGLLTMATAWNGGICGTYCMDFHGIDVTPGTTWQRFEIRFDYLKQQGWGDVQVPLRRDQLVGFVIWPNRQSDLWIDDVRFEP